MIRTGVAVASAAILLGGCGNGGVPNADPTPTAPVQAAPGFAVVVTENDRAVTVSTGQKIELVLRARSGMTEWSGVDVDNPSVLRAVPTGILAAKGVTIAGFVAIAPGTATIRATAGPLCSPNQACPQYAALFEVTVTVT